MTSLLREEKKAEDEEREESGKKDSERKCWIAVRRKHKICDLSRKKMLICSQSFRLNH